MAQSKAVYNTLKINKNDMKVLLRIKDFSKIDGKYYCSAFNCGGYEWRICVFPKGNGVDYLSIYLNLVDSSESQNDSRIYAKFSMYVVNQVNPKYTQRKDALHVFSAQDHENGKGFLYFMPLSILQEPMIGYLVNDTLILEAEVVVSDYDSYDSKKETGYVGLKNKADFCYMNSLLQILYHIPCFRKGTVAEGTIEQLFEGHYQNSIACINVDYESTRKESFYVLPLDVKGCRDVYASLDKYVKVECIEGDNKIYVEKHGLQDAEKAVLFIDFPPVLQLQMKRFEYDSTDNTLVKINDRYEFPCQLDLDKDNGKYLSSEADRRIRNLYTLHSVLIHSGGIHDGNYYALIRPTLSDKWYKFNDERVTNEDMNWEVKEQYGGNELFRKSSNAYILVYVRKSDQDKIMYKIHKKDIPKDLKSLVAGKRPFTESMNEASKQKQKGRDSKKHARFAIKPEDANVDPTRNIYEGGPSFTKTTVICPDVMATTSSEKHEDARVVSTPNIVEGGPSFSKTTDTCFDAMAAKLLEKLEDEEAPYSVRLRDFEECVSNNSVESTVDVGIFKVPSSLESYAKDLLTSHADIGTGNSPIHDMNEVAFVLLCCALKSMDSTCFTKVTESLILKWRDAIRGAMQYGFKVDHLKDHLKSIAHAYLAKLAINSDENQELQTVEDEITVMKTQLGILETRRSEIRNKMYSELRKTCEAVAAEQFPGETYCSFFI
ncbi:hypothetical protein ACFE04_002810 [Oxalis oulophora]